MTRHTANKAKKFLKEKIGIDSKTQLRKDMWGYNSLKNMSHRLIVGADKRTECFQLLNSATNFNEGFSFDLEDSIV